MTLDQARDTRCPGENVVGGDFPSLAPLNASYLGKQTHINTKFSETIVTSGAPTLAAASGLKIGSGDEEWKATGNSTMLNSASDYNNDSYLIIGNRFVKSHYIPGDGKRLNQRVVNFQKLDERHQKAAVTLRLTSVCFFFSFFLFLCTAAGFQFSHTHSLVYLLQSSRPSDGLVAAREAAK